MNNKPRGYPRVVDHLLLAGEPDYPRGLRAILKLEYLLVFHVVQTLYSGHRRWEHLNCDPIRNPTLRVRESD